jgi:hypothetical protein
MSNLILYGSSTRSRKRKGLRRPKLKKFPKTPKSFKIEVLNSYAKRCEEIKKINTAKLSEYNKKVKVRTDLKMRITKIKESVQRMKGRN